MISQIVDFVLFLLVLFVVVPGVIIYLKAMHGYSHNSKHAGWNKSAPGKSAS